MAIFRSFIWLHSATRLTLELSIDYELDIGLEQEKLCYVYCDGWHVELALCTAFKCSYQERHAIQSWMKWMILCADQVQWSRDISNVDTLLVTARWWRSRVEVLFFSHLLSSFCHLTQRCDVLVYTRMCTNKTVLILDQQSRINNIWSNLLIIMFFLNACSLFHV